MKVCDDEQDQEDEDKGGRDGERSYVNLYIQDGQQKVGVVVVGVGVGVVVVVIVVVVKRDSGCVSCELTKRDCYITDLQVCVCVSLSLSLSLSLTIERERSNPLP